MPAGTSAQRVKHDPRSMHVPGELPGYEPIAQSTVFRGQSVGLGVLLFAVAAFVVWASFDRTHFPDAKFHAPRGLVALIGGGVFGLPGLLFTLHGARGIVQARRAATSRRVAPDAPWRFDRAWGRTGEDAPRWTRAAKAVFFAAAFAAFLSIGWAVAFGGDFPALAKAFVVLTSAIALVPAWIAVRRVVEAVRYGRTYVAWDPFPAFVGERVRLRFGVTRDRPEFTRMTFRLRCVEEQVVIVESDRRSRSRVVGRLRHEATIVIDSAAAMPRPRRDAELAFDLPAGLPGTALDRDTPITWQLEVEGEAPGVDYTMRFLVPVYARS